MFSRNGKGVEARALGSCRNHEANIPASPGFGPAAAGNRRYETKSPSNAVVSQTRRRPLPLLRHTDRAGAGSVFPRAGSSVVGRFFMLTWLCTAIHARALHAGRSLWLSLADSTISKIGSSSASRACTVDPEASPATLVCLQGLFVLYHRDTCRIVQVRCPPPL